MRLSSKISALVGKKDKPILHIKQWSIKSGERIFLHGNSGSGKSTLLNIIAGVLSSNSGSVSVLGTELNKLSSHQRDRFRANHIGFIFQQFNLIPYLSVTDNIQLGAQFADQQNKPLSIETLCEQLKLETSLLQRKANQLSIGQQQRVAVARALYNQPELIIADEPTSALDSDNRDNFIQLLLEQSQNTKATVLFVSHEKGLAYHFDSSIALGDINHAA